MRKENVRLQLKREKNSLLDSSIRSLYNKSLVFIPLIQTKHIILRGDYATPDGK